MSNAKGQLWPSDDVDDDEKSAVSKLSALLLCSSSRDCLLFLLSCLQSYTLLSIFTFPSFNYISEVFKNYFILILIEIGVPPLYEPNQMKFSQKKAQQFFGVETQKAPSLFPYALKNCIVILYFTNQIIPCLLYWVTFCSNICLRRTLHTALQAWTLFKKS